MEAIGPINIAAKSQSSWFVFLAKKVFAREGDGSLMWGETLQRVQVIPQINRNCKDASSPSSCYERYSQWKGRQDTMEGEGRS